MFFLRLGRTSSSGGGGGTDMVDGFHASLTPAPNTIVPLDANGILDLSATYVKSNVYTFRRVDLTNATSDYMLQIGEEAIINFSNATSVPLRIATQSGTHYELDLVLKNDIGTSSGLYYNMFLYPNNTTYNNAFVYRSILCNDNSMSSETGNLSAFKIGYSLSNIKAYITNFTAMKTIKSLSVRWGVPSNTASIVVSSSGWVDTTTEWTSLGTITYSGYLPISGYILVRRLA